jgi:hypothetical protein
MRFLDGKIGDAVAEEVLSFMVDRGQRLNL